MILSLLADRDTYRPRTLVTSLRRFRASPLLAPAVRERLRAYDRPGFHPDDVDTAELVVQWRERLFGADGSLNDRLSGRTGSAA
jgi:predicted metal-dependent hydrolase